MQAIISFLMVCGGALVVGGLFNLILSDIHRDTWGRKHYARISIGMIVIGITLAIVASRMAV